MEDREFITGKLIATGLSGLIVLGGFALVQAFISKSGPADVVFQLDAKTDLSNGSSMVTKEVTRGARIGDTVVSPRVSPLLALSPSMSPLLSPRVSPTQVVAPALNNQPIQTVTPMVTLSVSPLPTPTVVTTSVTPSTTPSPSSASSTGDTTVACQSAGCIVINEIAWMGTSAGKTGSDEWIELFNNKSEDISLSGWVLKSETDDSPHILLSGTILARGYYLLERTDDTSVSDIKANFAGSFGSGGLKNDGEILTLQDKSGNIIDRVDCSKGWFYGDNTAKSSMERRDPNASGSIRSNWATNNRLIRNGLDASGSLINGTPGHQNSVQI